MLIKTDPEQIQPYLRDASYMLEGGASRVVFPQSAEEVAEVLLAATKDKTPVTVSGAGTGTVGGRIPTSGIILATDKLNQIKSLARDDQNGGRAVAEAGVRLTDFQAFVETEGLLYPPDPTERTCFLGGTVATNASGARTFKYGPTRNYILRLKVALPSGEVIDVRRGDIQANSEGALAIPLPSGAVIKTKLPTYRMPNTRKHAAGYYVQPGMDAIDLFIGSEGTLGVVVEIEVALIPKPEGLLSGVVFFKSETDLLAFVGNARAHSLTNRNSQTTPAGRLGALMEKALEVTRRAVTQSSQDERSSVDARALEYFDDQSLNFLREKYSTIPGEATGAIFFEQEITRATEDALMTDWLDLTERHNALSDSSWFANNEQDHTRLREFRHQLPVLMNEWFARHRQRKVSTDMSVPDEAFADMLRFYKESLRSTNLRYTIFGHIGDNHVHVNILPRNNSEARTAKEIYRTFVSRAVSVGGTISAEHGVGKLKREYLRVLYSDVHLREMAELKRAFDPAGILGRGNILDEQML